MDAPPATVRVLGGMSPFLLGAGAMFATMYSTQAILPQLGDSFGVSPSEAGLTISVLVVALAVGAWIWGPLSDRIGLRRSLTLASTLLVVPALVLPLAPTFALLLVARAAEGLVMPGLLTVGVGYIADVYKPRIGSRAMGYYVSTLVVGGLVGRLGVAFLTDLYGWRIAMAALAVLPAVAAVVVRRSLEADPVRHLEPAVRGARLALLRNRTLIGASAAGASLFFGFVGVFSFIDYRLEAAPFSYSPSVASLIFVLWIFGAVGPAAGTLSGRVGWRRVAVAGLVTALTGVVLTLSGATPMIVLGLALFAAAMFAGVTACQLGVASSTDQNRGFATAVYFSAYYIAGALGGYLPGLAWQAWGWTGVGTLAHRRARRRTDRAGCHRQQVASAGVDGDPRRLVERCQLERNQPLNPVVGDDGGVLEPVDQRTCGGGVHRSHQAQPVRRQSRGEHRHLDDQRVVAPDLGDLLDHLAIGHDLRPARLERLPDGLLQAGDLGQVGGDVGQRDRLGRGGHPTGAHHPGQTIDERHDRLERGAARADHHGCPDRRHRRRPRRQHPLGLAAAFEMLGELAVVLSQGRPGTRSAAPPRARRLAP